MLVKRCPGLHALEFADSNEKGEPYHAKHDDFCREAFLQHARALVNLSDLSLPCMNIKDEDMAVLLRQMTELRQLNIPHCKLGKFSLYGLRTDKQDILHNGQMIRKTRLRRLCETIETLVFDKHYFEVSGIVQAILSNCPHLKQLTGPKIMVTEIVSGVEWVSTRLTNLTIYLEANVDQETAEGMAKQRIAFRQLGKLTRLRTLDLTSWRRENDKRTLDLRLRAGLNELANLKNLDSLVFRGDNHQRMGLEEATWIVDNWPSIRCLNGHPTNEEDVYTLVHSLLQSHNIVLNN